MDSKYRLFVAAFALSLAACSSSSNSTIDNGRFYVKSDCVNPSLEREVYTQNGVIVSGGVNYTDFGFPNNVVRLGQPNTGIVGLVTRECVETYGNNSGGKAFVYSCADGGDYVCSIVINNY